MNYAEFAAACGKPVNLMDYSDFAVACEKHIRYILSWEGIPKHSVLMGHHYNEVSNLCRYAMREGDENYIAEKSRMDAIEYAPSEFLEDCLAHYHWCRANYDSTGNMTICDHISNISRLVGFLQALIGTEILT